MSLRIRHTSTQNPLVRLRVMVWMQWVRPVKHAHQELVLEWLSLLLWPPDRPGCYPFVLSHYLLVAWTIDYG